MEGPVTQSNANVKQKARADAAMNHFVFMFLPCKRAYHERLPCCTVVTMVGYENILMPFYCLSNRCGASGLTREIGISACP